MLNKCAQNGGHYLYGLFFLSFDYGLVTIINQETGLFQEPSFKMCANFRTLSGEMKTVLFFDAADAEREKGWEAGCDHLPEGTVPS